MRCINYPGICPGRTNCASCHCTLHYRTDVLHKENKEAKENREKTTEGQPLLKRENEEEQLSLARETEETDIEQPARAQGATEVRHFAKKIAM